ncbi:MAG: RlmE family RNA methyltransferase [Pseudomonadota bacterium]
MERSGTKRPAPGKPVRRKPRRPSGPIAKTALGAEPEKRGRSDAPAKRAPDAAGARDLTVKVKSAKGRKLSSTLWLQRQLNDPFVAKARALGYRSRAAFKLVELNEKFGLLKRGGRIVDLGCAPGGWCQVSAKAVGPTGKVVGIDYLGMEPVEGTDVLELDFLEDDAPGRLKALLDGPADVVLSDMAQPATGHRPTDHLKIVALCEAALDFAEDVLAPGGAFACKVLQGGTERQLLDRLKTSFSSVKHAKPEASRADSAEMYVVATGYRGGEGRS